MPNNKYTEMKPGAFFLFNNLFYFIFYILCIIIIIIIIILPQFCDVATLVSSPQEELAKFGYRPERKVETFKNIAIF
jgi:hypothetical protein